MVKKTLPDPWPYRFPTYGEKTPLQKMPCDGVPTAIVNPCHRQAPEERDPEKPKSRG